MARFMSGVRIFGIWFSLGAGLLLSGFVCVMAMRDFAAGKADDHFFLVLAVFVVTGGIFTGLLALAILRLAQPHTLGLGSVLHGEALIEHANRMGVSLKHLYDSDGKLQEPELQRRVLEVERALRERRLYLVAIGAAVFSGLSALAAWMVHVK